MEKRFEVVTFGETMIRLAPPGFARLEQAHMLQLTVGGSEMNVAVCLQRLGVPTAFVTRLTNNPLGRLIANKAQEHGVNTSYIIWTDADRVGLYFVEYGAAPRPNSVLYDRRGSAISRLRPGEIPWREIFEQAKLFHTSGITPALSPSAAQATEEALRLAKECGVEVSVDLNYRAKLWSQEEAQRCMSKLMEYTDYLITTEEDAERVFGFTGEDHEEVAARLAQKFSLKAVAITIRENVSVWRNRWTAIAYSEGQVFRDRVYELELVDRVGGGDAFTAGFLYGVLQGDVGKGVRFGNAASALKQTNPGDIFWGTLEEVERLVEGKVSKRIQR